MSEFMPEPSLVLATKEDLIAALADESTWRTKPYPFSQRVKSLWLIGLIDEVCARENRYFAYNSEVNKLACERLGYPPKSDREYSQEGTALSKLVYNAQQYHHSDQKMAAGYSPLTQAMVDEAFLTGAKIERLADSILGGPHAEIFNPREIDGKVYAMYPKSRKRYAIPQGQPAKIVAAPARKKKAAKGV